MAAKLSEGETISMQGEVAIVYDDGSVTVRLYGYAYRLRQRASISVWL